MFCKCCICLYKISCDNLDFDMFCTHFMYRQNECMCVCMCYIQIQRSHILQFGNKVKRNKNGIISGHLLKQVDIRRTNKPQCEDSVFATTINISDSISSNLILAKAFDYYRVSSCHCYQFQCVSQLLGSLVVTN